MWNSFVKLAMPVLALALVLLQGGAGRGRVLAALVGIGCYLWWRRQAWTTSAQGAQRVAGAPQ